MKVNVLLHYKYYYILYLLEVVVSGAQATVDCWPSWLQATPAPGRGQGPGTSWPIAKRAGISGSLSVHSADYTF